jgi:CW_7 repeat
MADKNQKTQEEKQDVVVNEPKQEETAKFEGTIEETPEKSTSKEEEKSVEQLVEEVIRGQHGTGRDRYRALGDKYEEVQHQVNLRIKKGDVK